VGLKKKSKMVSCWIIKRDSVRNCRRSTSSLFWEEEKKDERWFSSFAQKTFFLLILFIPSLYVFEQIKLNCKIIFFIRISLWRSVQTLEISKGISSSLLEKYFWGKKKFNFINLDFFQKIWFVFEDSNKFFCNKKMRKYFSWNFLFTMASHQTHKIFSK